MFARIKAFLQGGGSDKRRARGSRGSRGARPPDRRTSRLGPPSVPRASPLEARRQARRSVLRQEQGLVYDAVFDLTGRRELHVRESVAGAVAPRDMVVGGVAIHRGDLVVGVQGISVAALVSPRTRHPPLTPVSHTHARVATLPRARRLPRLPRCTTRTFATLPWRVRAAALRLVTRHVMCVPPACCPSLPPALRVGCRAPRPH